MSPEPQRNGEWIQTFSGGKFWPLQPRVCDINPVDIAHHLSMICRFTGAVRRFYSVAEHSCHVCDLVSDGNKLAGLLHDASEAYVADLARPVKHCSTWGPDYRRTESLIMDAVAARFNVDFSSPEIKAVDNALLGTERRQALNPGPAWERYIYEPACVTILFWPPEVAEREFMQRFEKWLAPTGSEVRP